VSVFAVIAGGGTAGHVVPAIAIADTLVARGHDRDDLLFVGAARGMEASMVPAAGYQVALLPVEGVRRSMSPANARAALRFSSAVPRSLALLRRTQPAVVVSLGGYASVPAVTAAWLLRIPIVVVSYDVVPGAAARLQSRLAAATAVAFESSPLPGKVVTGAPLRPAILGVDRSRDRAPARAALGLPPDRFTLAIVGGSLGSGKLNEVTASFVTARRDDRQLAIHHVLGQRHPSSGAEPQTEADGLHYQVVRYEDRMDLVYAAADVVLARAGATTVAELAAAGVPSVLVPWPLATEDHQTANAKVLADVGGAVLLPEPELSAARLHEVLEPFRQEPARLEAMSVRARRAGRRDGAERIADLVERHARSSR
jgi:undecaprenyldiphospho-muramoylpentapeptide beta-N-acetylglucosaminyltransferase